jgi:dienelactone hydrolase
MLSIKNIAFALLLLGSVQVLAQADKDSARAGASVEVPVADADGSARKLPAFWFAAKGDAAKPTPALVLLHGCGGPYNPRGELSFRMREYAALLNAAGYSALVVDSLTPRGETELCTQKNGSRRVTQSNRRLDALAALEWLAARREVDGTRLALLGWSNGGSTVLAATNTKNQVVRAARVKPKAAIAFYPGCQSDLNGGYETTTPVLMLVGAIDDWTPPEPCKALAATTSSLQLQTFADAYHGFDGTAPVRQRADVPNGVNPGKGVHVGGNPAAREASQKALLAFLAEQFK